MNNDKELSFINSDIHIEIDFELLGVNENTIFFEFFTHIKENIIAHKKIFYICCIHFNEIKQELLQIFHMFMNEPNIKFILLTNQISFLTSQVLKNTIIKKQTMSYSSFYNETYKTYVDDMVDIIINDTKISLFSWREKIYIMLIKNFNIHDSMSYLIKCLITHQYIKEENIDIVFKTYFEMIEKYNNNYRSIYHLEHFIIFLRNLKT
jgi:hypothetical protein